jgi:hypothetical protein
VNDKDYIEKELEKYPYRDNNDIPFRLERIDEHSWNVYEMCLEHEYGCFVGAYEKQVDDFDDCDTLEQAIAYWKNYKENQNV